MADFGELLVRYGARVGRLHRGEKITALTGTGGGLVAAVETMGLTPFAAGLADGDRVELEDDGVSLRLERVGAQVALEVDWAGGPSLSSALDVPAGDSLLIPPGDLHADQAARFLPEPAAQVHDLKAALHDPSLPLYVTSSGVWTRGRFGTGEPLLATIPSVSPEQLGDSSFCTAHRVRAPYVIGAMAGGIASAELVIAASRAGLLACFGAGGLPLAEVERSVDQIMAAVGSGPVGFNLLHNPNEPSVEEATVDLYLSRGCHTISASAYINLTAAVVRYRLTGIRRGPDGAILCPNRVFAKVSRPEIAERFMRPAPPELLELLVSSGGLTAEEAELGRLVPVAEDITAEADSGGHTDHRPLVVLLPTLLRLRDRIARQENYAEEGIQLRVGAAGGIGDPTAAHAALSLGAAYILTGSINQSTVEAGTSTLAKEMLAEASFTDCATGPAPDMFEQGAHVQVLGRGTMYAQRARQLHNLYRDYASIEDIPPRDRAKIERMIFRRSLDDVWDETEKYWGQRDPRELARAHSDGRHKMALIFRWYLGLTSRWARLGDADRKRDFQIWCGPAMGLFNDWVAGTWLEPLDQRRVADVADAMLSGVAALKRVSVARTLLAGKIILPTGLDTPAPHTPSKT
ncbi:MAG: PfaD family protein [Myxococcota bacterium]|jgi:PfaD family protein